MKVPYTNDTDKFVHIGSVTIAPFATRDVESTHIPGFKTDEPIAPPVAPDPLAVLLEGNVKSVTGALPDLSAEQVEKLGELEQVGQNRKGVLSAIAEILLKKAGDPPAAPAAPATEEKPE